MARILLVEDDNSLRQVLASVLELNGHRVSPVSSAEEGIELFAQQGAECIISDFKLPKKNGIELLADVRRQSLSVPFIIITAFGSIDIAVAAMKEGATDFVTKPLDPETFCAKLNEVLEHGRILEREARPNEASRLWLMSSEPEIQNMLVQARKVARVNTSVLLLGESGTGKELLARYIHEQSPRASEPFVAINCAAVPPALLESEFFGHEAGAFTGATQQRIGLIEYASEGTLFLDEVGDMPPSMQVKLLRALQEKVIMRVGGTVPIEVNPRIISATNCNIEESLQSGLLREDFYYRVAVVTLGLPPLRERPADVPVLVEHYMRHCAERIGKAAIEIDKAAREMLIKYNWPGNTRELQNVIERAVILADGLIEPEHLEISVGDESEDVSSLPEIAARAIARAERDTIIKALARTNGNKAEASRMLGVSYKTLLHKIRDYQVG